jgi:four helix bundle protein
MQFAVDVMRFLNTLPNNKEFDVFRYQLSKSATSVGANYNESQAGSYAEFRQRIQICLREARESHYFLKVIARLKIRDEMRYLFL